MAISDFFKVSPEKWIVKGIPHSDKCNAFTVSNLGRTDLGVTATSSHPWICVEPNTHISIPPEDSKDFEVKVTMPDREYCIGFVRLDASSGDGRTSRLIGILMHTERMVMSVDYHKIRRIFDRRLEEYYEVYKRSGFACFPYIYDAPTDRFNSQSNQWAAHTGYFFLGNYLRTEDEAYLEKAENCAKFILSAQTRERGIEGCFMHAKSFHRAFAWAHSVANQFILDLHIVTSKIVYLKRAEEGIRFLKNKQLEDGSWSEAYLCPGNYSIGKGYDPTLGPGHPTPTSPLYSTLGPVSTLSQYYMMTGDRESLDRAIRGAECYLKRSKTREGQVYVEERGHNVLLGLAGDVKKEGLFDLYWATGDGRLVDRVAAAVKFWMETLRKDGRQPRAVMQDGTYHPGALSNNICSFSLACVRMYEFTRKEEYLKKGWLALDYYLQTVSKSLNPYTAAEYGHGCPDMYSGNGGPHQEANVTTFLMQRLLDELEHYSRPDFGSNGLVIDKHPGESTNYFVRCNNKIVLHLKEGLGDGLRGVFAYKNLLWGEKWGGTALFGRVDGIHYEDDLETKISVLENTATKVKLLETKQSPLLRVERVYTVEREDRIDIEEKIEVLGPSLAEKEYVLNLRLSPIGYDVLLDGRRITLTPSNMLRSEYSAYTNECTVDAVWPFTFETDSQPKISVVDRINESQGSISRGEKIEIARTLKLGTNRMTYVLLTG